MQIANLILLTVKSQQHKKLRNSLEYVAENCLTYPITLSLQIAFFSCATQPPEPKISSVLQFRQVVRSFAASQKWSSLLKNSFVELYEEEKHQKLLFYDANSRRFGSDTSYFALVKTQQFSFSTGWVIFET